MARLGGARSGAARHGMPRPGRVEERHFQSGRSSRLRAPSWLGTSAIRNATLEDGTRIGRFVMLRDLDGKAYALATGSVAALCETEDGSLLMLPGGRMLHVAQPMEVVLGWLDGLSR